MTASSYNALLILLFSGTLIISVVVPCRGAAVFDTDGHEVYLGSTPGFYQYYIRYYNVATGSQGYLSLVTANGSPCQNYVSQDPNPAIQRRAMVFFPTSASSNTVVMQANELYEFRFVQSGTGACNAPGVWALGNLTGTDSPFWPIIAGQESGPSTRQGWFVAKSHGVRGLYWLAGCPCVACGIPCPADPSWSVSSYEVEGSSVLRVGRSGSILFQFERVRMLKNKAEQ